MIDLFRSLTRGRRQLALLISALLAGALVLSGCTSSNDSTQAASQSLSDQIGQHATNPSQGGVAYPLAQMQAGGWSERRELSEHLQRQNDRTALRYITLITQSGQVIAQYSIEGMVFDPNSQLTNTQNIETGSAGGNYYSQVVASPGDNGTWGPEAGNAAFYTTQGVEVQVPTGVLWVESDSPLHITSTPILTLNQDATPSVNHGGMPVGGH